MREGEHARTSEAQVNREERLNAKYAIQVANKKNWK